MRVGVVTMVWTVWVWWMVGSEAKIWSATMGRSVLSPWLGGAGEKEATNDREENKGTSLEEEWSSHADSVAGVFLYMRGLSTCRRRAEALAMRVEAEGPPKNATDSRKLRVLCLDGGGMKGLNMLAVVRDLERRAGRPAAELFDVVCGTSIGGCGALFLHHFDAEASDRAAVALEGLRSRCFAATSPARVIRAGLRCDDARAGLLKDLCGCDDALPVGRRSESASESESAVSERSGKWHESAMRAPAAFVVAARKCRESGDPEPYLFRTYGARDAALPGTSDATLIEAIAATTAAPTYFPPLKRRRDEVLADGGCAFNNPSLVALHEIAAGHFGRGASVDVLCSIGCGTLDSSDKVADKKTPWWARGRGGGSPADQDRRRRLLGGRVLAPDLPEEEVTHAYVSGLLSETPALYERLDPPLPGRVSPGEHRPAVLDAMQDRTAAWLQDPAVSARLDALAARLLRPAGSSPL